MKNILLLLRTAIVSLIFVLGSLNLHSQWVSIPDTNFGTWLFSNGYYTCVQGDNQVGWQMDTTCPDVVNAQWVYCDNSQISDLTGIEYFDNLEELSCSNNQLTSLPDLPSGLRTLNCYYNQLTSLPMLPGNLLVLNCARNSITSLSFLPNWLYYINCSENQISYIQQLPDSLTTFYCVENLLSNLPALPNSLVEMYCVKNSLTSLPALPASLNTLYCGENQLASLPALPDSLDYLDCNRNEITSLPALPARLTHLELYDNQLSSLPALPNGLNYLSCGYNYLSALPVLPNGLTKLYCHLNPITALPSLPNSITDISCYSNYLTALPTLPNGLTYLAAYGNQLTSLPALPASLSNLWCDDNQLTSLPDFPDSLNFIRMGDNPITCMPRIKYIGILEFPNTLITCLTNYGRVLISTPAINTLPLCGLFNPNGCEVLWNISGNVYNDENSNCVKNAGDAAQRNIKVSLWQGGTLVEQTLTGGEGFYSFDVDSLGYYDISIDTANTPFYVSCPANNLLHDTLSAIDSFGYNKDFAFECRPGFDLIAHSIWGGRFRPASVVQVDVAAGDITNYYGAHCAAGVSGAVTVTLNGPATYVSPDAGALTPSVSGNTLTYNIADYGTVNFGSDFDIMVQTDTTAVLGSQICFTLSVTPVIGDNIPANNTLTHCFPVVGSFDPNDKQVYPLSVVDVNGERWLTYTVNFQNTGTDTAIHIYITDTLDTDLDFSTFQLLAYNHQPLVQLKENAVRFNFPNIMLVDSHANEPLSHGYVQYKIKIKDGKPVGTVINNTAYIYFDFNAPVVTNTTVNTLSVVSSVEEFRISDFGFRIYPNPASSSISIAIDNITSGTLTATDITGREILNSVFTIRNLQFDIRNFESGVYFVTVTGKEGRSATKKLVINK